LKKNKILIQIFILLVEIEYKDARSACGLLLEREANKEAIYIKGKILPLFCY
jgi:hypothetical protein